MTGPEPRKLLGKALIEIRALKARLKELEGARHEPIAIVGYGCRFPGAPTPDAFWRLLRDGVDAVREVPRDRFDIDAWYDADPDRPGKIYTRSAAFLERVDGFDSGFFAISPREVANLSPQQRLLLEVAWESLEDANLLPSELFGSSMGVFVGQCGFDEGPWNTTGPRRPEEIDLYSLTGSTLSITANRLSYFLGVNGPSLVVDTACSSSLVALQLACQSLRHGDCERALVGGVHVLTSPSVMLGLCRIQALSPDGRCKTFDARADGYGRGEGCGVVLLRRLSDAVAAGDRIHAVIRGVAITQDGASGGLTVPSGPSQTSAIRRALADGAVDPAELAYVEAHGTGTSLGDPIEIRALHAVYDAHTRERPLFVGSVKSNIGHLEAAAGVAGLLKVVLALEHRAIPPSLHFETPNPHIPWQSIPVEVPTRCVPWPEGAARPKAGLSSFGVGGTNVHVVIEAAPPAPTGAKSSLLRATPVLLISGRNEGALRESAAQFERHIEAHPELQLAELCHAAATGRTHFAERAALAASDRTELRARLRELALGNPGAAAPGVQRGRCDEAQPPESCFVFPADLSLRADGGDSLAALPRTFQEAIARCAAALDPVSERPLADWLGLGGTAPRGEPAARLPAPAVVALELSLAALWRSFGVVPDFVVGEGVGEIAAAADAGILRWEEALQWAVAYARRGAPDGSAALSRLIETTPLSPPRCKFLSQSSATVAGDEITTPAWWRSALRDPAAPSPSARSTARATPEPAPSHRLRITMGPAVLEALVSAHVNGARVNWSAVEGGACRNAASLPTYPFQRERYPLNVPAPPSAATAGTAATAATALPFSTWLHEARWVAAPEGAAEAAAPGRWLVVVDRAGFGDALVAALAARGATCVAAQERGGTGGRRGAIDFDPRRREDYDRLLGSLGPEPVRGVVHLLGLHAESGDLQRATLERGARDACESALLLAQALARAAPRGNPRLWIVTRGAQSVTGKEALEPLQAMVWGLGRSFALEAPEIWGGLVDLDPALDAKGSAALLARELLAAPREERVALRGGDRHVQRLARLEATPSAPLALRPDASYLITGGLGGIGLELAVRLAARGARHLVLLGRRAPSEAARSVLQALAGRGCQVRVDAIDVADDRELGRLLDEVDRGGAPLRGLFHSAGVVEDVALARQGFDHFEKVLASKLHGTANLHRLTAGRALDHFVLFSSAAAILGSFGQANYAAANAYLDALAQQRRAQRLPALSLQWGAWAEVGLARDESILRGLRERGFDAMATAPALDALEWAMGQQRPQLIVAPVAWPRFLERLPPGSPQSLFADVSPAPASATASAAEATDSGALRAELERGSHAERRRLLQKLVAEQVAWVLRLPPGRAVDPEVGFFQMGMNSLTTVELRRTIGKRLAITVSATMVFDHPTVRGLAARLQKELFGDSGEETAAPPPTPDPRSEPVSTGADSKELAGASSDQVNQLLDRELDSLRDLLSEPGPAPETRK